MSQPTEQPESADRVGPVGVPAESPLASEVGNGNCTAATIDSESYFDLVWRQFKKNTAAYVSLWLLISLFIVAIFCPLMASNQPFAFFDRNEAALAGGAFLARLRLSGVDEITFVIEPRLGHHIREAEDTLVVTVRPRNAKEEGEYELRRVISARIEATGRVSYQVRNKTLFDLLFHGQDEQTKVAVKLNSATAKGSLGRTIYPWGRWLFNPAEPVDLFFNMAMIAFVPCLFAAVTTAAVKGCKWGLFKRALAPGFILYIGTTILLSMLFCEPGNDIFQAVFGGRIKPDNRYGERTFTEEEARAGPRATGWYPPIRFGPVEQDVPMRFSPPLSRRSSERPNDQHIHFLGTDNVGRDVLVQMIYSTRISLTIGFIAVSIYASIGVVLGAIAGYFGGWTDILISRVIEVMLLFPAFFLILTLVAFIGPSIYITMVVIGLTQWPATARLVRGEVLKQRAMDYTAAARALGAGHMRVIFRHILPNAVSPVLVTVPFGVAGAITVEAGLSLLGYGVRPPTPTWGFLLNQSNGNYANWWLIVFPSLAMFFTVTVFNLIGSGLRDAMDPRLRR